MKMKKLAEDYERMKSELQDASKAKLTQIKMEMQLARLEFEMGMRQWQLYLKMA